MDFGPVIIPSPADEFELQLTRSRRATGTVFRKHILNLGDLIHPQTGKVLKLDEGWFDQLKTNFDAGVCPIVQVPLADSQNLHDERPDRNLGEVIDIERQGRKVYALVDIRGNLPDGRPAAPEVGKTLLGTSAFLHMNYKDTRTGKTVGPTLLHACVTNRPYVTDLDDYEPVIAATAAADMDYETVVLTGPEEPEMPEFTKDELMAQLKNQHGIDVQALMAQASDQSQLTAALTMALSQAGQATDPNGLTLTDLAGAITELAQRGDVYLSTINELKHERAEARVQGLIDNGYLVPTQKAAMVKLAMNDSDMFDQLVPASPVIKMSAPVGTPGAPQGEDKHEDEIARLTDPQGVYAHHFVPSAAPGRGRRHR